VLVALLDQQVKQAVEVVVILYLGLLLLLLVVAVEVNTLLAEALV
jgi:hypothetical protein